MSYCSAILLAAGRSQRLGFDKILTPLGGQPVLHYSFTALMESPGIQEIHVMTRVDLVDRVKEILGSYRKTKPVHVRAGGQERQDSVWAGLQAISYEATEVLIHDAARPLLTGELIETLLARAREGGSAVAAQRATDTLKVADETGWVGMTLDRSKIWQVQTPQVFSRELIVNAYAKVQEEKAAITDDASAVERLEQQVLLVESKTPNLKITRLEDWENLERLFREKRGRELRRRVHDVSNLMSPLVGYLPLLKKYGGSDAKFSGYLEKFEEGSRQLQVLAQELQKLGRELFPDKREGPGGAEKE